MTVERLRFHWMLPQAGEVGLATPGEAARHRFRQALPGSPAAGTDLSGWTRFARAAEVAGIESVLISFSRHEPVPVLVSCALGLATEKLRFINAFRAGIIAPTLFVQQVNTLSTLIAGRVLLNFVAGSSTAEQFAYGDFLTHDERYARADDFLAVCHGLWDGQAAQEGVDFSGGHYRVENSRIPTPFSDPHRDRPEIFVSGHSDSAEELARSRGSCWLRVADVPEKLAPLVARSSEHGIEMCLRMCVLCRPTRDEALAAAKDIAVHYQSSMWEESGDLRDTSQMYAEAAELTESWLSPTLWTGLVRLSGPVVTTLIGTPEDIAAELIEYRRIGVTQFIMSGWPELEEVTRFGREVLPLVRRLEAERAAVKAGGSKE